MVQYRYSSKKCRCTDE